MTSGQRVPTTVLLRTIRWLAVYMIFLGVAAFLPAGDIRWANGWLFLLFFLALMVASIVHVWRVNPEIFVARSKIQQGTKGWDKVLVALLMLAFHSEFPAAALDAGRFHWSSVPLWLIVLGYVLFVVGYSISDWVLSVNKFAEPGVRIQAERAQKVIDTGPYAIVRHPMYVSAFFLFFGIPLALGSFWGLLPAAVASLLLVVRTAIEDKTLQEELEGYKEYAARIRCRLIPGVW